MNSSLDALLEQRKLVLNQMGLVGRLRRGSLSRQFFKGSPEDPSSRRGPYFVLQGWFRGRKFSERVPASQAPMIQEQVANYRRFQSLAEAYVSLSDQISRLEAGGSDRKKSAAFPKLPANGSKQRKPR